MGLMERKGMNMEDFKSIHIDPEKNIFLLNGQPMEDISELHLSFEDIWRLQVKREPGSEACVSIRT